MKQLNEQLKRAKDAELLLAESQGPQVFGKPVNQMGSTFKLVYMVGIIAIFCLIFYVLMNKLLHKEVSFSKQKRILREQKRAASGKKSGPLSGTGIRTEKALSSPKKVGTPIEGKKSK